MVEPLPITSAKTEVVIYTGGGPTPWSSVPLETPDLAHAQQLLVKGVELAPLTEPPFQLVSPAGAKGPSLSNTCPHFLGMHA